MAVLLAKQLTDRVSDLSLFQAGCVYSEFISSVISCLCCDLLNLILAGARGGLKRKKSMCLVQVCRKFYLVRRALRLCCDCFR